MNARDASSTGIKPLTKKTQDGELYFRRTDAQLQIQKISSFSEREIAAMLKSKAARGEPEYLLDETLCYLLREAKINGIRTLIESICLELNSRIWKLLLKFRGGFKNREDFEDFGQQVGLVVFKKLNDVESNAADFAQVQFGKFVIALAKTIEKRKLAAIMREKELFSLPRDDDEDRNMLENFADGGTLSADSLMVLAEGIGKLSPDQKLLAAMLLDGYKIESKDVLELTISRHLGITSRTVRYRIQEMRKTLDGYQGEAKR